MFLVDWLLMIGMCTFWLCMLQGITGRKPELSLMEFSVIFGFFEL